MKRLSIVMLLSHILSQNITPKLPWSCGKKKLLKLLINSQIEKSYHFNFRSIA
jgi:hypothetical protein